MEQNNNIYKKRTKIMGFVIFVIFLILLIRLYYLQFVRSEELSSGALSQRGKEIYISAKRGTIFDRNNIPLTNDEKIPTLIVQKNELLEDEEFYKKVQKNTLLSLREFYSVIDSDEYLLALPMKSDFSIEQAKNNLFLVDIVNRYNKRNLLSHVIGYINKSENRGESGIEKVFDEYLNIDSLDSFIVEYDKSRKIILDGSYHVNQDIDPYNPSGVKLTIDKHIQELVENIIDEEKIKGAVIVAEAETSDILAIASRPNFDQNDIHNYFNNSNMALYNKALQVGYPPGSIYKIVVLLTALEIDPKVIKDEYYCDGFADVNGIKIKCSGKHGAISLDDGFAKSCNSVFIQLAQDIGTNNINDMAKLLGFGEKVNIGLLEETAGNLPKGNELLGAAVGNIAIGQGNIEVTPLQITNMMMTIVNRGIHRPLNLIEGITNQEGYILKKYNTEEEERIISEESSILVLNMLREVVNSGTGRYIELEDIGGCGGKTGSAEGVLYQKNIIHGWFTGFYPYINPKYVITVFVEDADSGSRTAAPIFEKIIREITNSQSSSHDLSFQAF
ncbi:MAG: penicillin-binding protein 2 [Tissierellaceae bacterium]|nr:penicillin-binding protein 2 [Tissierellaceae bacterium]